MSKKYLSVVSAGVMAFGTLALGLVSVLPMASAANAETAAGAANAQGMYNQTNKDGDPNEGVTVDTSSTSSSSDGSTPSDTDDDTTTPEGMYTDPNKGCPNGLKWDGEACVSADGTSPAKTDPKTDPKGAEEKGGKTPVTPAAPKTKGESDQKGADQGATRGADQKDQTQGQQHVKKGHHKFGAPNTGYEF